MKWRWRKFWMWWTGDLKSPWVAVKWRVTVNHLDKPTRCWCRVVNWALGFDNLRGTLANAEGIESCKSDALKLGTCYCCRVACRKRMEEMGYNMNEVRPEVWIEP